FDQRQNFIGSSLYQLPFGTGRRYLNMHGPAGKVLEGWDVNAIVRFHSGFPYGIFVNRDVANVGSRGVGQHASLVPGQDPNSGPQTTDEWFNTGAFATCDAGAPGLHCFGDLGRNTMIGPGFKNFDLALHKTTKIRESHAIEFRPEFFNAFTNVNFSNPAGTLGNSDFGTITGTQNTSREIQFALKYIF